jgi:hypothetical protein
LLTWQIADNAFATLVSMAFAADDDRAFDVADKQGNEMIRRIFCFYSLASKS